MKPIVKSLAEYLESLGDSPYSVTGSGNQFRVSFPEGEALIMPDGSVKEHLRMPRAVIPAGGAFVTKVKRDKYGMVSELLELTHTFPLDYKTPFEENEAGFYPNTILLGVLDKYFPGTIPGGLFTEAPAAEEADWLDSRITISEDENGEPTVVLRYHPNIPYDLEEREQVYKHTRLSEIMTFEEFEKELDEEAGWTEELFCHNDIFDLAFEVVLAGEDSTNDSEAWEALLDDPLWLNHDGELYNVFVWKHED